jgi:hypothetical protein
MKKGLERTASTGAIAHLGIQWGEAWCSPRQKCFAFLVFCIMSYSCLQLFPPFGKMLRAFCVYTTLIYHSSSSAPFKKTAKIEAFMHGLKKCRGEKVFRSENAMKIYQTLGIQKEEIQSRQAWQNYIETAFNVQRRMADWHFEMAHTWEDLVAAHEKWIIDYNYQKHFAHEKREDGRHSPAEVLGWVSGRLFEPAYVHHAFSARLETRVLNKAGYARFRNFLVYGEWALAGKTVGINLFQDTLALEYREHVLAKYSVEFQPDDRQLLHVGNPRLFEHPYHSLQLSLWPASSVEWYAILPCKPTSPRRKRAKTMLIQLSLPLDADGTQG